MNIIQSKLTWNFIKDKNKRYFLQILNPAFETLTSTPCSRVFLTACNDLDVKPIALTVQVHDWNFNFISKSSPNNFNSWVRGLKTRHYPNKVKLVTGKGYGHADK